MHGFDQIDDVRDTITIVDIVDTIASVTSLLIIIFILTHGAFRLLCKFYTTVNKRVVYNWDTLCFITIRINVYGVFDEITSAINVLMKISILVSVSVALTSIFGKINSNLDKISEPDGCEAMRKFFDLDIAQNDICN